MQRSVRVSRILFICLLYLLVQYPCTHAHAAQAVTQTQWHELTSDKAFTYANDSETIQPQVEYKPGLFDKVMSSFFKFWLSKEGTVLLWIIVISIVCWVIYKTVFSNDSFLFGKDRKMVGDAAVVDNDEHDLLGTNWETLLHNAMNNNDLRLAARYIYMWMLQIMQQNELIQYRIDKTNYEYYTELKDSVYKQPFKQLSREYEYTWYGRFALSSAAYSEYKNLFDNIRKQLGA